jgi:hypothetical protein
VAFLVEMVMDGGMDGHEFLQTSHVPEAQHRPLPSSKWQVRILRPVVPPATRFLPVGRADRLQRGSIRAMQVGHEDMRPIVPLDGFLQEFQNRLPVSGLGDKAFEHRALVICGPPEVMAFAVDLHEQFVQILSPLRPGSKPVSAPLADLRGKQWTEPVPLIPDAFMNYVNPAPVKNILDFAEPLRKPGVQHHRKTDDFRAAVKVLERVMYPR